MGPLTGTERGTNLGEKGKGSRLPSLDGFQKPLETKKKKGRKSKSNIGRKMGKKREKISPIEGREVRLK